MFEDYIKYASSLFARIIESGFKEIRKVKEQITKDELQLSINYFKEIIKHNNFENNFESLVPYTIFLKLFRTSYFQENEFLVQIEELLESINYEMNCIYVTSEMITKFDNNEFTENYFHEKSKLLNLIQPVYIPPYIVDYVFANLLRGNFISNNTLEIEPYICALIETTSLQKGVVNSAFIGEKEAFIKRKVAGAFCTKFGNAEIIIGENRIEEALNTTFTSLFRTCYHELKHSFQKENYTKEISYPNLVMVKDYVCFCVFDYETYSLNHNLLNFEIDASLAGVLETYRYIKRICPEKALEYLEEAKKEFNKFNVLRKNKNRTSKKKIIPLDLLFDKDFSKLTLKQQKAYLQIFPVLQLEYSLENDKVRRKKTFELLKEISDIEKELEKESDINLKSNLSKKLGVLISLVKSRIISYKEYIKEEDEINNLYLATPLALKTKEYFIENVVPKIIISRLTMSVYGSRVKMDVVKNILPKKGR